ncbi:VOC family protein [Chitinimonas sp.]|uniref:VOC family protein n=1 Tax=Chitinimonas sp. TaxID=1934313 RepID=UPI0035B1931C
MANPVGWFEIYVQDMARARAFYEAVLAVTLSPLDMPGMEMLAFPMDNAQFGASGALIRMDGVPSGGNSVMVYFSCQDCAIEAARIGAAGGKLQQEKTAIGQYGHIALGVDPDGNMFGLHSMA